MFERFTAKARKVLVIAQEEAGALGHDFIGTEHMLLGLVAEGEGIAGQVLLAKGFTVEGLRAEIEAIIGPSAKVPRGRPPFTPRSKKVLELSLREALALGHNYIGTEHLLLAIDREADGVAAQLLVKHDFAGTVLRQAVLARLRAAGIQSGPPSPPRRWWSRGGGKSSSAADDRPAAGDPAHTPAVEEIIPKAEAVAAGAGAPVGSHHLLLAVMDDLDSLATRTLTSFGITKEALMERFAEIGVDGTTDEMPTPEPFAVDTRGSEVTIRIDDPELAEKVRRGEVTVSFKPAAGE